MEYLFTFTAYIDERKRPEGFPKVIYDKIIWNCQNNEEIVKFVNNRCALYTMNHGIGVRINPDALEDLGIVNTDRMWVPSHMITHLTATFRLITDANKQISETGEITVKETIN